MPTLSPKVTPYYGGGQVTSPANVIPTVGAPSIHAIDNLPGTIAVDNASANLYGLCSVSGGVAAWYLLGGASMGTFTGLTGDNAGTATPNLAINVLGTANQIHTAGVLHTLTLSLPAAVIAPGSLASTTTLASGTTCTVGTGLTVLAGGAAITGNTTINSAGAGTTTIGTGGTGFVHIGNATGNTAVTGSLTTTTTLTATLGNITATNGNLSLAHAGNKILIHASTAASDSVGTSAAMIAGSTTVACTAVTANSIIFLTYNTPAGVVGSLSAPVGSIIAATSFVINSSSATDTSTVNYWVIN